MQSTINHFANLILSLFPEVKEAKPYSYIRDFKINLSWLLNNDPYRPNKRSKTIKITISEEQMDDYKNLSLSEKKQTEIRLKKFIENKKSQLDANHNSPYGAVAPIEEWHVVL